MAFGDSDSEDGNDNLFLSLPYTRPDLRDYFVFWTPHTSSTKALPLFRRVPTVEAMNGIMSGAFVQRKEDLKYPAQTVNPDDYKDLGVELVAVLQEHVEAQSEDTSRKIIYIESRSPSAPKLDEDDSIIDHYPQPYSAKYFVPETLPGWGMSIYMSSKIHSSAGIVELYLFPPGPSYIPTLPRHSIRFKFSHLTGGKKDYDVLTDVPGAHYSLRLQCSRELQEQWPRLRDISPNKPGLELVLNNFIVPEIVFMASLAPDVLDREHWVDFIFRGFQGGNATWAEEVKVLVSHHMPFHFRGRKLLYVASN